MLRSLLVLMLFALPLFTSVSPVAAQDATPEAGAGTLSATGPFDAMVEIDGRDVHIICAGSGSPTIVFEVGGPNPAGGAEQAALVGNDVSAYLGGGRFCAYDRAGTGQSAADPKGVRTFRDSAADLNAVLAIPELGCPCIVMGESLGGSIALVALADDPGGFSALVLLDPAPPGFWAEFERLSPADSPEASFGSDAYWAGGNEEALDMPAGFRQLTAPAETPDIPIVIFAHGAGDPPVCFPCSEGIPLAELEAAWQEGLASLAEALDARLFVLDGVSHDIRGEAGDFVLDQTIAVIAALADPSLWATPSALP